jgi:hypothetical protein
VEKEVRISGMLFDLVEDGFVGAGVGGRRGDRKTHLRVDMRSLDPVLLQGGNPDAPPAERASNFKPASDRQMLSGHVRQKLEPTRASNRIQVPFNLEGRLGGRNGCLTIERPILPWSAAPIHSFDHLESACSSWRSRSITSTLWKASPPDTTTPWIQSS